MSLESIVRCIAAARERLRRSAPAQPAFASSDPRTDVTSGSALPRPGFAEEALPWIDAVYRFAISLTRGDEAAAEDLVQETYLRAYRSWDRFERGTGCRSWLFTICKNAFLHERERLAVRREISASASGRNIEARAIAEGAGTDPERAFFDGRLDDRVVHAIDALPREYHEVLVLSDLGDLRYSEIAMILEIPTGTVRSRLFRARRLLRQSLAVYAVDAGYIEEAR